MCEFLPWCICSHACAAYMPNSYSTQLQHCFWMQWKHVVLAAADIRLWHMVYWMSQRLVWPSSHATCLQITWLHPCITHFDPEDGGGLCLRNTSYLPITWLQTVITQDTAVWRPDKSFSSQTNQYMKTTSSKSSSVMTVMTSILHASLPGSMMLNCNSKYFIFKCTNLNFYKHKFL